MSNVVIQNLIESKRNKAYDILNPIFREVLAAVVKQMEKSTKLYPTVTISWTTRDSSKVNVKCGKEIVQLPVPVSKMDLSIEDIIAYVDDLATTKELENFLVKTSHPSTTHYEKDEEVLVEEGIDVVVKLKTLF